jgi:type II secretory pathway component GspD/PulD (secretin)
MRQVSRLSMLLLMLLSSAAWAQDQPAAAAKPAGVERKRLVYFVKNAPALNLATVLSEHFKGEADVEVRAIPDPVSNTLLISASPAAFEEVVQILALLDRAPPMITVEVLVVELESSRSGAAAGAGERRAAPKRGDLLSDLTGPTAEVLAKARRMEAGNELDILHRVRLTALANQKALVQVGERKPVVQGVARSPSGTIKNTISVNLGMIVGAIPRGGPDGSVVAEIEFEKSQLAPRPEDLVIAALEGGELVHASSIVTSICKSTVQIPRNQAVVLGDIQTTGKEESQLLLIVTASQSASEAGR